MVERDFMKITSQLTAHLVTLGALAAGASEQETKDAAGICFADGRLAPAKYQELTKEPDADDADSLTDLLKTVKGQLAQQQQTEDRQPKPGLPSNLGTAIAGGDTDKGTGNNNPRVIRAKERYDSTKRAKHFPNDPIRPGFRHHQAGQPFGEGDGISKRFIDEPSALDKAISGAVLKMSLSNAKGLPGKMRMTDHDWDLIKTAVEEYEWGGVLNSGTTGCSSTQGSIALDGRKMNGALEQKALIDDATSGGLEAAPIVFDDMMITTPLLYGEFYPSVNVVPITRGRRIEGVSIGVPTIQSGGSDNDNIDLFTTTAFIAAFDTTIFVADAAIEIGLDFLSDSPLDITAAVVDGYSRQLLAWLDEQICIGDGTTEPEGITVASGTASVAGGSAAPTVGVYESFFFGVAKKYKQGFPNDRIMFGANETTYQRARAIAVGASDARRIFGMTHGDYMLMGHRYGINENIANTKAFFANMARYRMYRRLGMTIKATTEGQTLVRKNLMMISCRSRWGGHLELGGAAAVSTTMQA
jgi:HK97 family phage major capsid protein